MKSFIAYMRAHDLGLPDLIGPALMILTAGTVMALAVAIEAENAALVSQAAFTELAR
jgi:hypothetical protein